jgi:hypothetical protein
MIKTEYTFALMMETDHVYNICYQTYRRIRMEGFIKLPPTLHSVFYYFRPTLYRTPNSMLQCTGCLGNVHEPLPSKMGSSMSGSTIPAFSRCLPNRFLAMDAWLRLHYCDL